MSLLPVFLKGSVRRYMGFEDFDKTFKIFDSFNMVSLRGKRETRVNGNNSQATMGRPLSPSRPPLRANFHRERDIWVRGRGSTIARQKLPENSFNS